MKRRLINEISKADRIVKDIPMYRYEVRCWCGELWQMTTRRSRSAREIVDIMAEECWSLDDDDHPQCTKCLRKINEGLRPKDPDNLGVNQRGVLNSLRDHGQWHKRFPGCGWVWDTPSNTKKILDTLVKRGLAQVDEKGTYTAK